MSGGLMSDRLMYGRIMSIRLLSGGLMSDRLMSSWLMIARLMYNVRQANLWQGDVQQANIWWAIIQWANVPWLMSYPHTGRPCMQLSEPVQGCCFAGPGAEIYVTLTMCVSCNSLDWTVAASRPVEYVPGCMVYVPQVNLVSPYHHATYHTVYACYTLTVTVGSTSSSCNIPVSKPLFSINQCLVSQGWVGLPPGAIIVQLEL